LSHGWEIGLHSNNTSTPEEVNSEKRLLEKTAGKPVIEKLECSLTLGMPLSDLTTKINYFSSDYKLENGNHHDTMH
jgi:hypothetical protein